MAQIREQLAELSPCTRGSVISGYLMLEMMSDHHPGHPTHVISAENIPLWEVAGGGKQNNPTNSLYLRRAGFLMLHKLPYSFHTSQGFHFSLDLFFSEKTHSNPILELLRDRQRDRERERERELSRLTNCTHVNLWMSRCTR
jgi:hypothetical protein